MEHTANRRLNVKKKKGEMNRPTEYRSGDSSPATSQVTRSLSQGKPPFQHLPHKFVHLEAVNTRPGADCGNKKITSRVEKRNSKLLPPTKKCAAKAHITSPFVTVGEYVNGASAAHLFNHRRKTMFKVGKFYMEARMSQKWEA